MKKFLAATSLFVVALGAQAVDFNLANPNPKHITPVSADEVLSFHEGIKDVVKSVVNISTTKNIQNMGGGYAPYYPLPMPDRAKPHALGSGVILTKDGYIVTNNHVVENADDITVTLPDSQDEYKAKLIGTDKETDLAVIKIEPKKELKAIKLANASSLQVGDVVFAVGNPFGVGESVTQGIISALNKNRVGINQYENFIQTDASINPGNSGGALVDSRGALIGINSVIISRSGGNNGIGFAIPVDMVKNITTHLIDNGKVTRGYIGVSISDVTKEYKSVYNHKKGAVVLSVESSSPAEKAGLKRGDLIFDVNGKKVRNATELKQKIASYKPHQKVALGIERDKKDMNISAVLASRDALELDKDTEEIFKGMRIVPLSGQIRYQYRIPPYIEGVLIEDIKPMSKAEKVGFQAGDVIIQIEDDTVNSIQDLQKALQKYKRQPKRIYVNRYGTILMLVIK
ncbi:MAG: serine protease [Sulfurospirillum sp.]|nr:MAG: serine protease [Sulfurospirillum sp.]